MGGYLWAVGSGSVLVSGVLGYALTRRYGWGAAIAFPLLAMLVIIAMQWQAQALGPADGMRLAGMTLVFSLPVLLGVCAGIAIARLRRG